MEVKLVKPITLDGEVVNKIKINEADITVGLLIDMQKPVLERDPFTREALWRPKTQIEQSVVILKSITGAIDSELSKLSAVDYANIMEAIAPFLDSQDETEKSK